MNCLICTELAERFASCDQWEERVCPNCGHYKISLHLISAMIDQGQIFDIHQTREWLVMERISTPAPAICLENVILAERPELTSA